MKRFEYASTELKSSDALGIKQIQEHLTAVGTEGWELVCQYRHARNRIEFTFKREIDETESASDETGIPSEAYLAFDALTAGTLLHETLEGMLASLANIEKEDREQLRERIIEEMLRVGGPVALIDLCRVCSENTYSQIETALNELSAAKVVVFTTWRDRYQQDRVGYKLTIGRGGPVVRRRLKQPAAETVVKGKPEFFGQSAPVPIEITVAGRDLDEAPKYWIALSRDRFDDRPVVGMHAEKEQDGDWVLVVYHE